MPTKFLFHTFFLFFATTGIFLWLHSPLESYTLQLVAILVLVYASIHWLRPTSPKHPKSTIPLDLTLLLMIILLLVSETGVLTSPFFFLLYFLLFATALLYEIEATLILTGTLFIFLLFSPGTDLGNLTHLSQFIGLIMVTPLAIYTGHQHEVILEKERLARSLREKIGHTETDVMLFLSLNLKHTLLETLDTIATTIPSLPTKQKTSLTHLYRKLKALYRTSHDLADAVES